MRVWLLSLLGALLVCGAASAADEDTNVVVETTAPVDVAVTDEGDVVADVGPEVVVTTEAAPHHSLRDEYRQWSKTTAKKTTRSTARTSSGDEFDSVNDIEDAGRDIEDWANEDLANSDSRIATHHAVDRYADYPEYDGSDDIAADRVGDRMYDDTDRYGSDSYWSRSYGTDRYWDSRSQGCPCKSCTKCARGGSCGECGASKCGSSKCGSKCGVSHKPAETYRPCDKCTSKCGTCHKPAVTYTPCDKCVSKCNTCHKPAATCNKCGRSKCGGKCGKCNKCGKSKCSCRIKSASRKCSKC